VSRAEIGIAFNATTTSLAVRAELRGATATIRTRVLEIGVFNEAATAQVLLFGRAAAIGVTPTSPITLLGADPADGAFAQTAIAWATAPTLPTNPLKRVSMAAAIGAGMVWTWQPSGLVIPLSGSLIFWNSGVGSAALGGYFVTDE
jgi:hypothetical protein